MRRVLAGEDRRRTVIQKRATGLRHSVPRIRHEFKTGGRIQEQHQATRRKGLFRTLGVRNDDICVKSGKRRWPLGGLGPAID